jgi:MoaA/NifB/PqqE/SkfB family radical SAM enzyme
MYEQLASNKKNELQISSKCNANCFLCCNKQGPFPYRELEFRPLEEIKKAVYLLDPASDRILLNGVNRLPNGEPLIHKDLFEILALVRNKFPQQLIGIDTNGTMLTESFIKNLISFKPIDLSVSYHSHNPEYWCEISGLGRDKYNIVRNSFAYLRKYEFIVSPIIIAMPNYVGYDDLEKTIKHIQESYKFISVYIPGYTSDFPEEAKEKVKVDYNELNNFCMEMMKKLNIVIQLSPPIFEPLRFYPKSIIMNTFFNGFGNVVWLFSECAFENAKAILEEECRAAPNNHYAKMVKNHTYGGNIMVSGLLTLNDFRTGIKEAIEEFKNIDMFVLPKEPFNAFDEDLNGENFERLGEEFSCTFIKV